MDFPPPPLPPPPMMGGHSSLKQPTEEDTAFFATCKELIEAKTHQTYSTYEVHHFTSQVVAGTIYWVAIKVDNGQYVHAKIIKFLPYTGKAPEIVLAQTGKAENDPFDINAE